MSTIRRAVLPGVIKQTRILVGDSYRAKGYVPKEPSKRGERELIQYDGRFDFHRDTHVLAAERSGEIIGTISVSFDGELALPVDREFPRHTTILREATEGGLVSCIWRFAIHPSHRGGRIAFQMLVRVFDILVEHEAKPVLTVVHPKHATEHGLYREIGFTEVARVYCTHELEGTPGVLLAYWGKPFPTRSQFLGALIRSRIGYGSNPAPELNLARAS
jgi:GNAT superfamily N-acetyltransferase